MEGVKRLADALHDAARRGVVEEGFLVKTVDEDGCKVFVNVVGSSAAAAADAWGRGQIPEAVRAHLERPAPSDVLPDLAELLDLRAIVGSVSKDTDHSGRPCTVVDLAYNDKVVKLAKTWRPLKMYLVGLALDAAQRRLDRSLSRDFRLPKTTYRGDLETRREALLAAAAPLAESGPRFEAAAADCDAPPSLRLPDEGASMVQELTGEPADRQLADLSAPRVELVGRPVTSMRVSTVCPEGLPISTDGVAVWCAGRSLDLEVVGCRPVRVALPFFADSARASARVLDDHIVVELPYEPIGKIVAAAC